MTHAEKGRICIISQYFPPDVTGDVIRLLNALKALKSQKFEVTVIAAFPHYPDGKIPAKYRGKLFYKEKWNGIEVIRTFILPLPHKGFINRFLLYLSFSLSAFIAIFLVKKVRVVWAFSQKFFSYIPGIMFKLLRRTRLLLDITDIWPEAIVNTGYIKDHGYLFKIIGLLLGFFFRIADQTITLTNSMKKMITSTGISPSKVTVLPNVIDSDFFKPMNVEKGDFNRKFVVMYSGNLGPNYDFKTLLNAALKLKDKEDILFVIRGKGEMKSYIETYIKTNQLKNVYLDEKILDKHTLIEYLNKADVFILPMKKCPYPDASFPIKLLDYLGCGKPVICCTEGFLSKLISKYQAGIPVSPENPDEIKEAILFLKENPKLREKMAKNAQELAMELFSYNVFKERIRNIFESHDRLNMIKEI